MSKKRPRGGSAATLPETTPTVEPPTAETLSDETREFLASLPAEVRASMSAKDLAELDREPTADEIEAAGRVASERFLEDRLRTRAREAAEAYRANWVDEYLSADALGVTAEMFRQFSRVAHRLHYERDGHDRSTFPACRAALGEMFAATARKLQAAARTAGEVAKYVEWEQAAYRVLAELKWPKYTVPNPVDPLRAIQATGPADLTPSEWAALRGFEQEQTDRLAAFERRLAEFIAANRYFQLVFEEAPIRLTHAELGCAVRAREPSASQVKKAVEVAAQASRRVVNTTSKRVPKASREVSVQKALDERCGFPVAARTWPSKFHDRVRAVRVEIIGSACNLGKSSVGTTTAWRTFETKRKGLDLSPGTVAGKKPRERALTGEMLKTIPADRAASAGETGEQLWREIYEDADEEGKAKMDRMSLAERQEIILQLRGP